MRIRRFAVAALMAVAPGLVLVAAPARADVSGANPCRMAVQSTFQTIGYQYWGVAEAGPFASTHTDTAYLSIECWLQVDQPNQRGTLAGLAALSTFTTNPGILSTVAYFNGPGSTHQLYVCTLVKEWGPGGWVTNYIDADPLTPGDQCSLMHPFYDPDSPYWPAGYYNT